MFNAAWESLLRKPSMKGETAETERKWRKKTEEKMLGADKERLYHGVPICGLSVCMCARARVCAHWYLHVEYR